MRDDSEAGTIVLRTFAFNCNVLFASHLTDNQLKLSKIPEKSAGRRTVDH